METISLNRTALSLSGMGLSFKPVVHKPNIGLSGSGLYEDFCNPNLEEESDLSIPDNIEIVADEIEINLDALKEFIGSNSTITRLIKKLRLNKLFIEEYNNYSHYILDVGDLVFNKTENAIEKISSLNYESASLELTPDKTIIFSLRFKENKNLRIEMYFNPKGGETKEAFFALFQNKRCINNGIGTLEQIISQNKEVL